MSIVMIAVDGTPSDRKVINKTLELLGDDHEFLVVSVSENPAMIGTTAMGYANASIFSSEHLTNFAGGMDEQAEVAAQRALAAVSEAGIPDAETVGEVGDPATLLVKIAADRHVAVIAIGASERSWMSRLLDPSVEKAVIGRAACPVLVIHPDSD